MALTPKQALEVITREDREIATKLEEDIDKTIRKNYQGTGTTMRYDLGDNVPARVLNTVKEIYNQAGWEVKTQYDQRDGAWLELTERRTRDLR